ncbi:MAG TPA: toxin glutamine deamidase domain-containing protein [Blastocatellia bacterium]|nr:toxin glutamine deamidase domain-containing protein [Blastocatellia bacterium]
MLERNESETLTRRLRMKITGAGSLSRLVSLFVLCCAVSIWICAGAAVAAAQPDALFQSDRPVNASGTSVKEVNNTAVGQSLEGNWIIEWHNYPEDGQVTRLFAILKRQWEMKCLEEEGGGCRHYNVVSQTDKSWTLHFTSDRQNWGEAYPQVDEWGNLNYEWQDFQGRRSTLRAVGPNDIRGSWSTPPENPNERKGGAELWRRVLPDIKRVIFKGVSFYDYSAQLTQYDDPSSTIESEATPGGTHGKVEGTYGSVKGWGPGNDMRGNRPKFKVQIYGENLWGHHLIDVGGALDLEPLLEWRTYILKDGSKHGAPSDPTQVAGIEADVVIWPKARPGEKELRVDGVVFPFELVLHGYPGAPVSEKRPHTAGTADEGSLPYEAITIIVVGAVAGAALANRIRRRLPRRNEPPAQAIDLRADVDAAKAEFERLQQALRERVNRELAEVRAFNREFDEKWAAAMEALEDYMKRYPELLPGLTALMEQASSREFARQVAQWADTALNAAMIGQGLVKAGMSTARRASNKVVRQVDDAMVGTRAERPREPRAAPKSKKGRPVPEGPLSRSIREAAERASAEERVLKKVEKVNLKAEKAAVDMDEDLADANCVSAAMATDQCLAGELSANGWPNVLLDGPQALPSAKGVNPMDLKEMLLTRISRIRGLPVEPTDLKGVAKGIAGRIQIEEAMKKAGEGARGIVVMRRLYRKIVDGKVLTKLGNHALNVVNENGHIIFVDGQSRQIYRSWDAVEDLAWIRTN